MAKPEIPPNTLFIKWRTFQIVASGHMAIGAVIILGALLTVYLVGKGLGLW
jgi:hypothetical protein